MTKSPQAIALAEGDMVKCPDGRIGTIHQLNAFGASLVRFGADGPLQAYDWKDLRHATLEEVRAEGLFGGGPIIVDYGHQFKRERKKKQ